MKEILLVEDDMDIAAMLMQQMEYSGIPIIHRQNLSGARTAIIEGSYSLVLLDLMLPDGSGLSLLPLIKSQELPVIILSALDQVMDRVKGLEQGADDYITKPFDSLELQARIRAVLRRTHGDCPRLSIKGLEIDLETQQVFLNEQELELSLKEYELLICLAQGRGRIFSRDRLLERIWGYESSCDTRTVDMHITRLRRKVGADCITTVYKRGYRIDL